jgi:hypothetical protein
MEFASCQRPYTYNFEVISRFLENLRTPVLPAVDLLTEIILCDTVE